MVGVEADAVLPTVIGDPADVARRMGLVDAPGLSGSGGTIQVIHGQVPVFFPVLGRCHGLPQCVNVSCLEGKGRGFLNNLHGGAALLHALEQPAHGGGVFLLLRGERPPLVETACHRGFRFLCVRPLALFGDVIPVLLCRPLHPFDMGRGEFSLDRGEPQI